MDVRQVFPDYEPLSLGPHERFSFCPVCASKLTIELIGERPRQRCLNCRFIFFHNPAPGVPVLVVDEGRFLLCKRSTASLLGPGKWCLPGGHVEWDENFLRTGVREVKEETGVDIEIMSIISVTSIFHNRNNHSLAVVLLARAISGIAQGDGLETDAARWFSVAEPLPDMAFEGDRHIIERYFEAPFAGIPVDLRYAK
jgi:ADP-ribose pyrophosphatase YjhB (NUDIX family)